MENSHEARVRLVCTGGENHKAKTLERAWWWTNGARQIGALIIDHPDRSPYEPVVGDWPRVLTGAVIPPSPTASPGSGVSQRSYQFVCPKCSGPRRVDAARLWQELETRRRGARQELDVSALG
jgi:hypothetical protein